MPHLLHDFREKIFPLLYFITDQVSLGHLLISALELVIGIRIGIGTGIGTDITNAITSSSIRPMAPNLSRAVT